MKRSRTCLNLVELDAPAATPKRTCSLPNLTWNSSTANPTVVSLRQNDNDTMLLFQQHAASGMLPQGQARSCHQASTPITGGKSAFVVDSIVPSRVSLSEIIIHEGQQFIGEEAGPAVAASVAGAQSSADSMSVSGAGVFGRAGHRHGTLLFDDDCDEDSSDYFCGVASSDEAEQDSSGDNVAAAITAAAEDMASDLNVGSGVSFTRQVSDAGSSSSSVGQVSVSSSSSDDVCVENHAFTGESDDFIVGAGFDECAQGAAASVSGAARHQAWGERVFGAGDCGTGKGGHGTGIVPLATVHLSSASWRSPTTGAPRVTVRVCSPSGGGSGGNSSASRQRGATVPPPWPMMSGWSGEQSAGRSNWLHHRRPHGGLRRGRGDGGVDEEDGSLVSAGYDPSDDAKMLVEMDRLRLVEPEAAGSC